MIPLLALVALFAPTKVVELVEPAANEISIQALVTLPELGAKDQAKLEILARAIPKQTLTYPRREMLMLTNGEPVVVNITPDHVRLVVNVPPGRLWSGMALMDSLLREATLNQDNLDASTLETEKPDYWSAALNPIALPSVHLSADEAQILYHRVFRPDRVYLAVGGQFTAGEAEAAWTDRVKSWHPEPIPHLYFDQSAVHVRTDNPGGITTIDLSGAPIQLGDTALAAKLLAVYALGVGKGASLFRQVREKHGWSYRQEALISPSKSGLIPRLIVAGIPSDDTKQRMETIKADLLEDINNWTEASRLRAVGMSEAVLIHHVRFNPLYLLGNGPVGNTLADRTYLAAYWPMKTGQAWNSEALFDSMKQVSLSDLKLQALAMINSSIPRVLTGN